MFKKFISVVLLIIFSSVFANAGGVTNVKEVVNNTAGVVKLLKRDFTGNAITTHIENTPEIAAGTTWKGDMWVPWANNAEEFKNHFMQLYTRVPSSNGGVMRIKSFYIWQTGESVRFTDKIFFDKSSFSDDAPKISGEAQSGGERRLVVSMKNNEPVFTFEKLKK
ncbi:MAG: hypothetical protein H0U50_08265 [Pyrinomonadaceae bacterium]|nr:hypothetical protein [Pyrinomonadaceae bacterium]